MLRIVIPTHRRVERQVTLRSLPAALRDAVTLVASDAAEAAALRKLHPGVTVVHAPVKTIALKRQWIVENLRDKKFIMLDDDMGFFGRCPLAQRAFVDGRWKPKVPGAKGLSVDFASDKAIVKLFSDLDSALDSFAHVGISSRLGNDLEPEERRIAPQRMMHAIGYDRTYLRKNKISFDRVPFREDFHVTLELLKRGEVSYVAYDYCVSPGSYGAPGGCADERTTTASDRAAQILAELHPGLVKVVDKNYQGTPRKEVVVSWRKAHATSQRS